MKNKSIQSILFIGQAILGLLLALLPFVLSPVCPPMKNGHYMSCHYSGILLTVMGVIIIALALLPLGIHRRLMGMISSALNLILAVIAYLIPHRILPVPTGVINGKGMPVLFGLCNKDTMPCTQTFHHVSIVLLLLGVLALVTLIFQILKKETPRA